MPLSSLLDFLLHAHFNHTIGWNLVEPRAARGVAGHKGEYPALKACKRSEEHTSELQSLMRTSYAVFCLKKKKTKRTNQHTSSTKLKLDYKQSVDVEQCSYQ